MNIKYFFIAVAVICCTATAVPEISFAKKPTGKPAQPKKNSIWTGSASRKPVKIKVIQLYNFGGSYLAAQLTWPKIKMQCYLYDPQTRTFSWQTKRRQPAIAVWSTRDAAIKNGKFNWKNTYGGNVLQHYQGTFTGSKVKGSLETLQTGNGIECIHPKLKFEMLKNN